MADILFLNIDSNFHHILIKLYQQMENTLLFIIYFIISLIYFISL